MSKSKSQRNSAERVSMLNVRAAAQRLRGGRGLPQKASSGCGNYPGGVRRKERRLPNNFAAEMKKLEL